MEEALKLDYQGEAKRKGEPVKEINEDEPKEVNEQAHDSHKLERGSYERESTPLSALTTGVSGDLALISGSLLRKKGRVSRRETAPQPGNTENRGSGEDRELVHGDQEDARARSRCFSSDLVLKVWRPPRPFSPVLPTNYQLGNHRHQQPDGVQSLEGDGPAADGQPQAGPTAELDTAVSTTKQTLLSPSTTATKKKKKKKVSSHTKEGDGGQHPTTASLGVARGRKSSFRTAVIVEAPPLQHHDQAALLLQALSRAYLARGRLRDLLNHTHAFRALVGKAPPPKQPTIYR